MLFFHSEERIEQFRLDHLDTPGVDVSRVCGWISAALWRGVKEMDLVFNHHSNIIPMLPAALLFTSNTLVRLKLETPFVMAVPVRVCLPSLKTLELESIVFEDDDSVKRLFSSCPILEDLSITHCDLRNITCINIPNPSLKSLILLVYGDQESRSFSLTFAIVFDLPNLVYFKYEGHVAKSYSMVNMPSLVRADIEISRGLVYTRERDALVELFQGICNVKSLHLSVYPEALPVLSHKHFVAFQNLHKLNIFWWIQNWKGTGLAKFLEFSPNLQTLVLANEVSFPMEKVPSCLVYQLKKFKLTGFKDHTSLFGMVAYILKNATVLEKLTVCSCRGLGDKEKFKITKQLLSMPRNSNKCQVMAF
ncbi:hypothetical protein V6N12_003233 [Hibiscus sabdariffa]|uniref:FBD domain-containing protein n=2 Tax=Hibiscus sabdariffa TaxID=183260 RepID=A0ABR2EBS5_9ROSI